MWTPLANAAQSGDDRPPPSSAVPGVLRIEAATCRAISGAGSPSAPAAQLNASSSRLRASTTTAAGRSSYRVDNANDARRSARVSLIEALSVGVGLGMDGSARPGPASEVPAILAEGRSAAQGGRRRGRARHRRPDRGRGRYRPEMLHQDPVDL